MTNLFLNGKEFASSGLMLFIIYMVVMGLLVVGYQTWKSGLVGTRPEIYTLFGMVLFGVGLAVDTWIGSMIPRDPLVFWHSAYILTKIAGWGLVVMMLALMLGLRTFALLKPAFDAIRMYAIKKEPPAPLERIPVKRHPLDDLPWELPSKTNRRF